ncbi:MAG: DNA polymerase III subunit gamma/tau [Alphaproteobacteria bacterium]|nr:DNA polymerase III subunit gamma/tau [Alphaproteobacteria bacterium]|tara:strand:- start:10634 stop:12412 length:1779 start_codon:yes stop_codon:yes gene_type:complete
MNEHSASSSYRVLARKYRPQTFSNLVGQEVLVRTLTNAIRAGRLPQAFVLTGVRGVGKTSTARIIAKAMNCTGRGDGPTEDPCGTCENCVAISEDRHVDVLEMDAASHTGVDDIRDLIDGVRYAPVSGRYKVYIIDEVHMLSRNAFNALLKTLEEPPPHAMFVFATTEVRRIPVTVLSRCMRFDLRRIESQLLVTRLASVCDSEKISVESSALDIIARAAEGSARDALSLLDQAAALAGEEISADQVRDMLGLADSTLAYDLFEQVMRGDAAAALASLAELVAAGAEPDLILEDLLALTHWLTRVKVVPESLNNPSVAETDRVRGGALAKALPMPVLTRAWQILLKGLAEVRSAPSPGAAAEMVIVRLGFAANLPAPADIVRQLQESDGSAEATVHGAGPRPEARPQATASVPAVAQNAAALGAAPQADEAEAEPPRQVQSQEGAGAPQARTLADFEAVVDFVREMREPILETNLRNNVHLVSFDPGRIELRLDDKADRNLPNRLGALLSDGTGERWVVSVSQAAGAPTLNEQAATAARDRRAEIEQHPLVRKALETFPGAEVREIRDMAIDVQDGFDDMTVDPDENGFYEE